MSAEAKEFRQAKRGAHHLGQSRIGEDFVEIGEAFSLALEIEREADTFVFLAGVLFQGLTQKFVDGRQLGRRARRRRLAVFGKIEGGDESDIGLVGELVGRTFRIGDAAFEHLSDACRWLQRGIETIGRQCIVQKALVGHQVVDRLNVRDPAKVIVGLDFDEVFARRDQAGLRLHRVELERVLLDRVACRRRGAVFDEVEGGDEGCVTFVGQLVCRAVRVAYAACEHRADLLRIFRIGVEAIGAHGYPQKTLVAEKIVDRLHLADIRLVVVGLGLHELDARFDNRHAGVEHELLRRVLHRVAIRRRRPVRDEIERRDEVCIALVGETVGRTLRIRNAAFQHLADALRCLLGGVEAEGAHGDVQQAAVGHQVVNGLHVRDVGDVVADLVLDEVESAIQRPDRDVRCEVRRRVMLRAIEGGRLFPVFLEVVGADEFGVALVLQLVGETVGVADAFLHSLDHEGFGIGHVFQPVRLHGVAKQAVVLDELLDGFHLRDILDVIFGLAVHQRLALDAIDRLGDVSRDELIARVGADQDRPPAEAYRERLRRFACARLNRSVERYGAASRFKPHTRHDLYF